MTKQTELNKKVQTCVNDTLKAKLIELNNKYKTLCYTEEAKEAILTALNARESDMISCLNTLALITTRLAITKPDAMYPVEEYAFQGSEKLYNLLDEIRHEYRMMEFDLNDMGIKIENSQATNNMLFS